MSARSLSQVPRARAPKIVQAVQFGAAPFDWMEKMHAKHGDVFAFQLPGDPIRVLT